MIRSVEKALRILAYVANKQKAGPSQVARELRYEKSSVIRSLQTMEAEGFVKQDQDTGAYELGLKALELAQDYLRHRDDLVSLASDQLTSLWEFCGETVGLYIREGERRVCISRIESPRSLRHSVRVGQTLPLYPGASGKVFLAYMPKPEVESLLARMGTSPRAIKRVQTELAEIKEKGIASSIGAREPSVASVAAPVMNGRTVPVAVMFVSGPLQRFTSARMCQVMLPLAAAARAVSERIFG